MLKMAAGKLTVAGTPRPSLQARREGRLVAACLSTRTTAAGKRTLADLGQTVGQLPSEPSDRYGSTCCVSPGWKRSPSRGK